MNISSSTLKRRLTSLGLSGKTNISDDELGSAIEKEESGCFVGYRKMWARIRKRGIIIKRARVMTLLKELDPDGVETRGKKRLGCRAYHTKGPNFIWHVDGHDKLKPFGFSVHGCVDCFSRRLLWLEVGPTNKNPEVIAKFYLDTVKQLGGVPWKIRSDDETEKSVIEALHTFLRSSHADENAGPGCFNIGRSTANQIIESNWLQFKSDGPSWWINFFKDLSNLGLFNSMDPVHQECIRFCFMQILRNELNEVAEMWNQHIIASCKFGNSSGPRGRPDCMFFLPHLYNSKNYKLTVDPQELEEFISTNQPCILQIGVKNLRSLLQ